MVKKKKNTIEPVLHRELNRIIMSVPLISRFVAIKSSYNRIHNKRGIKIKQSIQHMNALLFNDTFMHLNT